MEINYVTLLDKGLNLRHQRSVAHDDDIVGVIIDRKAYIARMHVNGRGVGAGGKNCQNGKKPPQLFSVFFNNFFNFFIIIYNQKSQTLIHSLDYYCILRISVTTTQFRHPPAPQLQLLLRLL